MGYQLGDVESKPERVMVKNDKGYNRIAFRVQMFRMKIMIVKRHLQESL